MNLSYSATQTQIRARRKQGTGGKAGEQTREGKEEGRDLRV